MLNDEDRTREHLIWILNYRDLKQRLPNSKVESSQHRGQTLNSDRGASLAPHSRSRLIDRTFPSHRL